MQLRTKFRKYVSLFQSPADNADLPQGDWDNYYKQVCNKYLITMKKLFLALGVIAMLASFSSCNKTCTCKQYVNGELLQTTSVEGKGKCSDLNVKQETMGMVQETKCENE